MYANPFLLRAFLFAKKSGELLKVAYTTLKFEQNLVSTGGNKKGFINAKKRLTKEAIDALKAAWYKFYSNNDENVIRPLAKINIQSKI